MGRLAVVVWCPVKSRDVEVELAPYRLACCPECRAPLQSERESWRTAAHPTKVVRSR
ncbi:hypothetical protein ACIBKY_51515 [Nonomuraea sp. NPDC050394]|uniref:hypothetical protein n=1 Tax=Nonomuraea sp. NPDC050394 TaxID=3364363 RepID=UPI0037AF0DAE